MGQDSMGRVWNKVCVSGEAFRFFLGHVDQDLMDNIDRGTVDENFHSGCSLFAFWPYGVLWGTRLISMLRPGVLSLCCDGALWERACS